jgi:hypothetical protein
MADEKNKEIPGNFIEGIRRWVQENYISVYDSKDPNITLILDKYRIDYGTAPRVAFSRVLKTNITVITTTVITTAFKLSDPLYPDQEIIYSFLYTNPKVNNVHSGIYIGTERLIHQLYCSSASLLSRDGEYRQRVNPLQTIISIIEKYSDVWNDLEIYVLDKVKRFNWNLFTECFYPKDELKEYASELETDIISRRFNVILLIACWFVETINIVYNQKINHTNKLFKVIMKQNDKKEVENDINFFNNIIEKYTSDIINMLYNNLNCYTIRNRIGHKSLMKIGQKIIPLNLSEVQNPFNIKYKPWKEYLISEKVQSLVINGICAGLPLLGDYFYIKNTRKTLFDNYVQYMKLEHSEQAVGIARKLIEAQRSTFKTKNMSVKMNNGKEILELKNAAVLKAYKDEDDGPDSYQEIEEWLSGKFRVLHEKIDDPIEYAREDIIMSEMALCITSEYVGRTFYDAINISLVNEKFAKEIGNIFINYDCWAKYIFELVYTLYCLNSKKGIIHGDLHLNNFTIHPFYFSDFKNPDELKNPCMLFALDKNNYFLFPSRQYHLVIIDFSRSLIRPSMLDTFENFDIESAKKLKLNPEGRITLIKPEERSDFFREQVIRVVKFYELYFPDITATKKSQISILFLNNFDKLFPIIAGIDTYVSINNLILWFKKNGFDKKHIKHYTLLTDIFKTVEVDMTNTIERFLDDPKNLDVSDIEYTNKKVLDNHFNEFLIKTSEKDALKKALDNNTVIHFSLFDNTEKYNLDKLENFPEYTKSVKYYISDNEIYEPNASKNIIVERLLFEKEKIKNLHYISNAAASYVNKIF